jgi:hypothetical protein
MYIYICVYVYVYVYIIYRHLLVSPISHPKPPNWSPICYLYASKCSQICHPHFNPFYKRSQIYPRNLSYDCNEQTSTTIQELCARNACVSVLVVHGISARKTRKCESGKTGSRQGKRENGHGSTKTRKPDSYIQI